MPALRPWTPRHRCLAHGTHQAPCASPRVLPPGPPRDRLGAVAWGNGRNVLHAQQHRFRLVVFGHLGFLGDELMGDGMGWDGRGGEGGEKMQM